MAKKECSADCMAAGGKQHLPTCPVLDQAAKATARVTVTLDIDMPSVWGGECPIEQVWNQARRECIDALAIALNGRVPGASLYLDRTGIDGNVRVVGTPIVRSIVVPEPAR